MSDIFPGLPLLDRLVERFGAAGRRPLGGTAVVGVQHLLETTGSLVEALFRVGLRPEATFLLGKFYSTNPGVLRHLRRLRVDASDSHPPELLGGFRDSFERQVDELWHRTLPKLRELQVSRILILDDGGQCIARAPLRDLAPTPVAAVEQTTSGVEAVRNAPFPVIQVATSAVKRILEPPLIARAIVERLPTEALESSGASVAVVGMGYIGHAVAHALASRGKSVLGFDTSPERLMPPCRPCRSLADVVASVDTIFGCSGDDILADVEINNGREAPLHLISCSSGDREFKSVLRRMPIEPPRDIASALERLEAPVQGRLVRIFRGGYPFNFDRSPESVPAASIQLTRGLLMAGLLQAASSEQRLAGEHMLDADAQRFIAREWADLTSLDNTQMRGLSNRTEIAAGSGGLPPLHTSGS